MVINASTDLVSQSWEFPKRFFDQTGYDRFDLCPPQAKALPENLANSDLWLSRTAKVITGRAPEFVTGWSLEYGMKALDLAMTVVSMSQPRAVLNELFTIRADQQPFLSLDAGARRQLAVCTLQNVAQTMPKWDANATGHILHHPLVAAYYLAGKNYIPGTTTTSNFNELDDAFPGFTDEETFALAYSHLDPTAPNGFSYPINHTIPKPALLETKIASDVHVAAQISRIFRAEASPSSTMIMQVNLGSTNGVAEIAARAVRRLEDRTVTTLRHEKAVRAGIDAIVVESMEATQKELILSASARLAFLKNLVDAAGLELPIQNLKALANFSPQAGINSHTAMPDYDTRQLRQTGRLG